MRGRNIKENVKDICIKLYSFHWCGQVANLSCHTFYSLHLLWFTVLVDRNSFIVTIVAFLTMGHNNFALTTYTRDIQEMQHKMKRTRMTCSQKGHCCENKTPVEKNLNLISRCRDYMICMSTQFSLHSEKSFAVKIPSWRHQAKRAVT